MMTIVVMVGVTVVVLMMMTMVMMFVAMVMMVTMFLAVMVVMMMFVFITVVMMLTLFITMMIFVLMTIFVMITVLLSPDSCSRLFVDSIILKAGESKKEKRKCLQMFLTSMYPELMFKHPMKLDTIHNCLINYI